MYKRKNYVSNRHGVMLNNLIWIEKMWKTKLKFLREIYIKLTERNPIFIHLLLCRKNSVECNKFTEILNVFNYFGVLYEQTLGCYLN